MFSTFKMRLLLAVYIFLILTIPVVSYYISQNQQIVKSRASEEKVQPSLLPQLGPSPTPQATTSAAKELLDLVESENLSPNQSPSPLPSEASSPTIATSFGPTMSLKVNLEGRPAANQATKLFVGIVEGQLTANPKFLLNFSVNVGADGNYSNLSLAGLSVGSKYTALVKGSAQLAQSVEYVMSPNVTNLNDGQAISLLAGDLNEDNTVNSSDYAIVKNLLGQTSKSPSWNDNIDLNKDGVINTLDLSIVSKNLGKTGASGVWTSPLNKNATPSASINLPVGSALDGSTSGYWIWIPR